MAFCCIWSSCCTTMAHVYNEIHFTNAQDHFYEGKGPTSIKLWWREGIRFTKKGVGFIFALCGWGPSNKSSWLVSTWRQKEFICWYPNSKVGGCGLAYFYLSLTWQAGWSQIGAIRELHHILFFCWINLWYNGTYSFWDTHATGLFHISHILVYLKKL